VKHPGDLLSAYVDGEASAAERRMIDEHIGECAGCRDDLADLAEVRGLVQSLALLEMPKTDTASGIARRLLRPALAWAFSGLAVAALALGLAFAPGESESTFDLDALRDQHTARLVVDPGISTVRGGP
jgi:anti-sigma factor RsiW